MYTLSLVVGVAAHLLGVVTGASSHLDGMVLAAVSSTIGSTIANTVRTIVAPIVLLAISLYALKFLAQRQVSQFIQWAGLVVLVGVFFYVPGIVENIARFVASLFQ